MWKLVMCLLESIQSSCRKLQSTVSRDFCLKLDVSGAQTQTKSTNCTLAVVTTLSWWRIAEPSCQSMLSQMEPTNCQSSRLARLLILVRTHSAGTLPAQAFTPSLALLIRLSKQLWSQPTFKELVYPATCGTNWWTWSTLLNLSHPSSWLVRQKLVEFANLITSAVNSNTNWLTTNSRLSLALHQISTWLCP